MERSIAPVPEGEREHSVHPLGRFNHPPLFDGREQDLSVRGTAEPVSSLFQGASQLNEVVDLTVVRQRVPAAGREHRLVTFGRQIDD